MATIWIKKIEELSDAMFPNNIPVGWEFTFNELPDLSFKEPQVGERFRAGYLWSTSNVVEILDNNKFKTLSSIYEWQRLDNPIKE